MTNSRIFKIAHKKAAQYQQYNETYREAFSRFLKQQYRFEKEAKADGSITYRIEIQNLLIAA